MKECLVYYDMWQYECCGKGFDNGYPVKWIVRTGRDLKTSLDIGKIDYWYEGHSSDWENLFVLEGIVKSSKILYQKYDSSNFNPIAEKLGDFDIEGENENLDGFKEAGFIIWLKDFEIRRATKEDIK